MFWGTSIFGSCLMFSSERRLLEDDCADVDYFPGMNRTFEARLSALLYAAMMDLPRYAIDVFI